VAEPEPLGESRGGATLPLREETFKHMQENGLDPEIVGHILIHGFTSHGRPTFGKVYFPTHMVRDNVRGKVGRQRTS